MSEVIRAKNVILASIAITLLCSVSTAHAWDPLREVSRDIRRMNSVIVAKRLADEQRAREEVARARAAQDAPALNLAQQKLAQERAEADRFEKELQRQIEARTIAQLQSELPRRVFVEMPVDELTLSKVIRALAKKKLSAEPRPLLNYMFVHIEPLSIAALGPKSTAELRMSIFWRRSSNQVEIYYEAYDRRLRSPDARRTKNLTAVSAAKGFISEISVAIRGEPS